MRTPNVDSQSLSTLLMDAGADEECIIVDDNSNTPWFSVRFAGMAISPTHYSLKIGTLDGAPRHWILEVQSRLVHLC